VFHSCEVHRIVFRRPNRVIVEHHRATPLNCGFVRVRTDLSLISNGTEKTALSGRFDCHWATWVQYPFYPGYSTVGTVVEAASDVHHLNVGQRVSLRVPHASEHQIPAQHCIPIPGEIPTSSAVWFALSKIGFLGVYAADVDPSWPVLVIGGGPIAQMIIRWLKATRCSSIAHLTAQPTHLTAGKYGGADYQIAGRTTEHSLKSLTDITKLRPKVIIDCTADPSVLGWALKMVDDYGRIVLVGDPGFPNMRSLRSDIITRAITVVGTHDHCTYGRWSENRLADTFFGAILSGVLHLNGMTVCRFNGMDASQAYRAIRKPGCLGVAFTW